MTATTDGKAATPTPNWTELSPKSLVHTARPVVGSTLFTYTSKSPPSGCAPAPKLKLKAVGGVPVAATRVPAAYRFALVSEAKMAVWANQSLARVGCMQAGALQAPVLALQMSGDAQCGVGPAQTPAVQTSPSVHRLLSLQVVPFGALVWAEHAPVAGTQVPATWQASVATGQVTGLPPTHAPAWQVSTVVQALPSLQVVPLGAGVWAEHTPVDVSQVPGTLQVVAVQTTGAPPVHVPRPLQMSVVVQALPSLQEVPAGAGGVLQVPLAGLQVPATWQASEAVQTVAVPPTQWPAPSQWSAVVQALPSSQVVVVGALPAQGSFALVMVKTCEAVR
jgi:hypothetical protein